LEIAQLPPNKQVNLAATKESAVFDVVIEQGIELSDAIFECGSGDGILSALSGSFHGRPLEFAFWWVSHGDT